MSKKLQSALLSFFLWGSGQLLICKQRVKGLIFFLCQLVLIGIEFNTGYWANYFSGEIEDFSFRLYGGFFTKGIWGLLTLGDVEGIRGDHSTKLMVNGIISIMILSIFLGIFIWNVIDAFKTGAAIDKTNIYESSSSYGKKLWNKMFVYIVLAPIAIILILVVVMPILVQCLTAFTNYNRDHLPPGHLVDWVAFSNFKKLFDVPIWSTTFLAVLVWTVIWTVLATLSSYFFGLFQALILNSDYVKHKGFFRMIFILPWAIPAMISLLVFKNLLNGQFGPINQFLMDIGIIGERIPFLTDPLIAKITLIIVNLWLGFPSFMIMMLGILSSIDKSLNEAARIDGAREQKVFAKITLPLVLRATAPLLIMSMAYNFNNFSAIYFMTGGGPVNTSYQFAGDTDILISWIYKLTLSQQMYSMAAVMNILIFVFIGIISIWNLRRTSAFKEV